MSDKAPRGAASHKMPIVTEGEWQIFETELERVIGAFEPPAPTETTWPETLKRATPTLVRMHEKGMTSDVARHALVGALQMAVKGKEVDACPKRTFDEVWRKLGKEVPPGSSTGSVPVENQNEELTIGAVDDLAEAAGSGGDVGVEDEAHGKAKLRGGGNPAQAAVTKAKAKAGADRVAPSTATNEQEALYPDAEDQTTKGVAKRDSAAVTADSIARPGDVGSGGADEFESGLSRNTTALPSATPSVSAELTAGLFGTPPAAAPVQPRRSVNARVAQSPREGAQSHGARDDAAIRRAEEVSSDGAGRANDAISSNS